MPFKDDDGQESHKQCNLRAIETKDYNLMIDERNSFDQPIKNDLKTYDNIRKISASQDVDYTKGSLLDYL